MRPPSYRDHDKQIWESIFRDVPEDWFEAGPSDAIGRCLEFFQGKDAKRLLDVGCGVGRWSLFLSGIVNSPIVGIDYSPNGVRVAASWAQRSGKILSFVAGDAVSLPFLEDSFDGVVVALLLDNLSQEDSRGTLREIDAVVSSGADGFFVFNPWLTQSQQEAISESNNPTRDCMQVAYKDEEIKALFETWSVLNQTVSAEGFRIVEAKKV